MEIDSHDKALLAALLENSRLPLTQLAKLCGLSKENTHYRLQRLQREGVIKSFVTAIDHKRLGLQLFTIGFALHKASPQQEQEMMDALAKHPNCTWLGPAAGSWNILADAYAQSREALEIGITPFYEKYKTFVSHYRILQVADMATWFNKHIATVRPRVLRTAKYVPDDTDKRLLAAITDNSRASYVELSKTMKLTANACKYRLRNLERTGIIQGYTLNIEPTALGYQWYTVELATTETDAALLRRFYTFCESHPDIIFYYRLYRSGAEDFYIGFLAKTHLELRVGLSELRQKFPGITVTNLFLPYEQTTSHSLPPAVFQNR